MQRISSFDANNVQANRNQYQSEAEMKSNSSCWRLKTVGGATNYLSKRNCRLIRCKKNNRISWWRAVKRHEL